jgi:radical SAM family uncharacterized protein
MSRKKTQRSRFPDNGSTIRRPGRYVGREWNLPEPSPVERLRIVLCYPDVYEIGMSHPGLQILFHAMQLIPEVVVERVFAPWPDRERAIRSEHIPLATLESRRPVITADVLCFTIPHELACTNILNVLDLSGIPLRHRERTDTMPFVFGGGIVTMNPLPLSPFFDGFFIGEIEDRLDEIIAIFKTTSRNMLPGKLARIPGVYIPSLTGSDKKTIRKQFVADLDTAPLPNPPLVPYCRPVHERVVVETSRGCPRTCRFCQARMYYQPLRTRSNDTITQAVLRQLDQTGYEEVSLLSLNIADHPGIEQLLTRLFNHTANQNVSISLPSLRPEKLTPAIINLIRQVRKTGFTLAPEAGSDRLRTIIGKPFPMNKLLETAAAVFQAGWQVLKLYFMIGLPFETDDDVNAINQLVHAVLRIGRRIAGSGISVHVSAATFIPKPHTAFQWCGQASEQDIRRRQLILKTGCGIRGVKLSLSNVESAQLEACLARGDIRASDVIETAFRQGCRMDAWEEWFNAGIWQAAFETSGISLEDEATRFHVPGETGLPWSFIDCGIPESDLIDQYLKAQKNALEPANRPVIPVLPVPPSPRKTAVSHPLPHIQEPVFSYAGVFQVVSDYRLFAHMEIMHGIVRAMRRAGLPLLYSKGFNPHPKITWPKPAPLGFERWNDPIIFQFSEAVPESAILQQVNMQLPQESAFLKIVDPEKAKNIQTGDLSVIALRAGSHRARHSDISVQTRGISVLDTGHFGPKLKQRLSLHQMNFLCVLPGQTPDGTTLKELIFAFFGTRELPLDSVSGVRIGWMDPDSDGKILFGMETEDCRKSSEKY